MSYHCPTMNTLRIHGPVYLLLLVIVLTAFGKLTQTALWDPLDAQILCDAHVLSQDPATMFGHLGFYFSQPVLQLAFLAEYRLFGLEPAGYIWINLFIHTANSFVIYMLVNMLFPHQKKAFLASLLFALGVGSYGKVFMAVHQLETLLLALFHLLVLYFFIRNDFRRDGSIRSSLFALGLVLFLMTGLTKAASFSLIGVLIAYKAFFYKKRAGRSILSADLLVFVVVGILFYTAQSLWGFREPAVFQDPDSVHRFDWISFKNIFRYLNLMFFPMQRSPILEDSATWVVWVFHARTVIRVFLSLAIIAYSFFGFVFGSRAVRFFIAWTYITLLPFTGITDTGEWLNLSHLYLTSLGFCVILAAGTTGTSGLLSRRRWRRYVPYVVPLAFILVSITLTYKLNERHRRVAETPAVVQMRADLVSSCQPTAEVP